MIHAINLIAISLATTLAAPPAQGPDPNGGVVQCVVLQKEIYVWTLDEPPNENALTTFSTITKQASGANGTITAQPVHSFLFSIGHRFPLRWSADNEGLWVIGLTSEANMDEYVPGRTQANRVPAQFVVGRNPPPRFDPDAHEGLIIGNGLLSINNSRNVPLSCDIRPAFTAAYSRDLDSQDLAKMTPYGEMPKETRPPFTFDFSPPRIPDEPWILCLQRSPRKTVDRVTFRPRKEDKLKIENVESIPVPFAEPFYAHNDRSGQVFFVTQTTGRVFVSRPPAGGRKGWTTEPVWSDPQRPVVAIVRDSRNGSVYACISDKAKLGRGNDRVLSLSGVAATASVDLGSIARPAVAERALPAMWFGAAIASRPPCREPESTPNK